MAYIATTSTNKLLTLRKRIRAVAGGTSAGKSIGIMQILIDKAQIDTTPTLTSIVSESFPHLKRGVMRDFKSIMVEHNYWDDSRWNATDYIYTFESNSRIEFFSADQPSKVRGPRRDRLWVNECNNVDYEAFDQLEVRTKEMIWLDYNPTSEFWFYTEVLTKRDDVDFITLTYKDNEGLPESIIKSIESHKHNKNWWTVYGLGQLGEIEGRIYTDWQILDSIPHEARLERRGLDFGYTNDPTALISIYHYNGGYILDEELYRKGMHNKDIADFLNTHTNPHTLVIADQSEPKSIDEIKLFGVNILPCEKGKGSIKRGIDYVQSQRISVTKRSINLIKEYRNYLWLTDKDGKVLNEPEGGLDHAMDALRYGLESLKPRRSLLGELGETEKIFDDDGFLA